MRTFLLTALFFFLAPALHAESHWLPVQGDLSGGGIYGRYDVHPTAAAYLGFAAMDTNAQQSSFFGAGIEGTVTDYRAPYQWTAGLGSRVGAAWRWRPRAESLHPDLYLYARVTPIIGGGRQGFDNPDGTVSFDPYKIGGGIRVGVGFTAPGWTLLLAHMGWNGLSEVGDIHGDDNTAIACAAVCATYVILTIVNHAEVTWESYGTESRAMYGRVGFRIGTGF